MTSRRLHRVWWFILLLTALLPSTGDAAENEVGAAKFYRGICLNGPGLVIDGHAWEGKDAQHYLCNGQSFENQQVGLKPNCDPEHARMIRSSRWGNNIDVELTDVPDGIYQVFLYVWEDNDPTRFQILVNDRPVVDSYNSRGEGIWARLGPWKVDVTQGKGRIKLSARGGDANLSGLEVWTGQGEVPRTSASSSATPEQLQFFESRIRPMLVQHCYSCHSAGSKKIGGNLQVDSRPALERGGDTEPAIVPYDTEASLLMTAIRQTDPGLRMPPKSKLSPNEIADVEAWIKMGAPDPRTEVAAPTEKEKSKYAIDWAKAREFWSFKPVSPPQPPAVRQQDWPANAIDHFILAKLESEGRNPVGEADRPTLMRRATYDLTGLPPTPEEIEAFVNDKAPDAFARVVDRLLASPRYGERWGRYWLDVVRYADTAGDNSDFPIPQMVKYRDWVIAAFNRNLPYDRFVKEQLAGDLLPAADRAQKNEQTIATGYIANARRFGSRVSDYPQHLTIEDTIDNVGRAFLGLTINCARCHDHKFDPLGTEDYYALYGFFQNTRYPWPGIELEQSQRDLVALVPPAEVDAAIAAKKVRQKELDAEVHRVEKDRDAARGDARNKLDKALRKAKAKAEEFEKDALPFDQAYAVSETGAAENTFVQIKGDPNKKGALVPRHFPTILGGAKLPDDDRTSGRLKLAEWIADPKNPLTARVVVNRLWLYHFGKGIVPTPNDFGRQGRAPTHPELLDWLANQFVASGWSVKEMHRTIMLSRTYRLASHHEAKPDEPPAKPELLGEFPRRRLDAEAIRDTLLTLAEGLEPGPGGPHPFPPQSQWKYTQHNPFKAIYETNRRSVYLMTQRIQRHPYLAIFDGADPSVSTPQRITSTTPLQALYLLNDPFVHEQSRKFASRLLNIKGGDPARLERAYLLALGRKPEPEEAETSLAFLRSVCQELNSGGTAADQVEPQAWHAFARALFRLNEFVYID